MQEWVDKIRKQVAPFLDFDCGDNSAIAANNYDWFGSMNVLTFLRDIGKHFSVNQMINKEAVKQRLNRDDQGISFTEFSYNLLQGYDFACLNKLHGVALQIGGSDQWGNITSGIDLTRRLHQNQVFGLTVPLITKADGTKFGKTEGGAVWLDPKKTSPYKFYQFWINTADADVYRFLKFFTFMDIVEINALEEEDKNSGKAPRAQYVLAEQVTRLVHGEEGLEAAKRITESLFNGNLSDLSEADFEQLAQDGVPMIEMEKGADLLQALVDSELQPSRGQARKTVASNAVTINGEKQADPEYVPPSHLTEIVQGIADIDKLQTCDAVLSGYLGSAEQGEHILGIVRQVKEANPAAKYFCDPVMGHPEKGCIVAPGVAEFHVRYALPASDIIAPNLVELEILCGHPVASVSEAVAAARELIAQGPEVVLVKHLARAGLSMDRFEMLLVTAEEAWHISRPLVDFGLRQPVGVGDVTSGLLLVKLLQGASLRDALEHVTAAVYEIMLATKNMQEYELQVVAAQDRIAVPEHCFSATRL